MAIMDKELFCMLSLGVSFMLLLAADTTMQSMAKVVVSSIEQERAGYNVESYTVSGLSYNIMAISLWVGPYLNYALGPKLAMALSALGYLFYVISYALEEAWIIFAGAVVFGVSAGTLWPAEGHYMIRNSSKINAGRNAAILQFFFTIAMMVGNVFIFVTFKGLKYISQSVRHTAIYSLAAINAVAIVSFLVLPTSKKTDSDRDYGPIRTIKRCFKLLGTRKMLWLLLPFAYAGFQQSFWTGIYSSSIGFTLAFGDSAKELVGLSGIFISIGGIVGSFTPIVLAGWIRRHSYARRLIVVIGCASQICGYLIAYLNLPNTAVFGNTDEPSIIGPSIELALTGSVLLSFGDSCLSSQVYSLLSEYYSESSAEACALYKFIKCVAVASTFYLCSHFGMHTQTLIQTVAAIVGVFGFCMADNSPSVCLQDTKHSQTTNNRLEVISST